MSPRVERIHSDEHLPAEVDVVIVGGGILGSTAAYFLAKRGLSVALLEKGHVACEQSSRNWGWCRQQNRDRRELPLSVISMRLWDELTRDIGRDLGFRRCGLVYATHDEAVLAGWERWREVAREYDVDTRLLSRAELAERVPEARDKWVGGTYSERDGKAEPALAAPAIAEGARALGATIHQRCAARALDVANGKITGVYTEKGYIKTSAVLCAAGAWSSRFLGPLGISFPQASIRQTALRSTPTINIGEAISTPFCTITRRLDGSYTLAISGKANLEITPRAIRYSREFMPQFFRRLKNVRLGIGQSFLSGPDSLSALMASDDRIFEQNRVLDPPPLKWLISQVVESVRKTFPQLSDIQIESAWGGYVDCTPDAVPVVSQVDAVEGLVLAAGCSGHGFGLGPGLGYLAAELVANDTPSVDPTPFRLSRLVDGSKLDIAAI
ncbi:NAD(P)/FAD-dependent oxidoreductase [Aminobacter aminovorans]|jgi:glycine/D-amino acid oxidase-like deaminating enzyme|uniref:D-amino acid oxidase n=1 Tax=Aminobacter aminovorans TaxID=83263 RepID=A0AAC8YVU2_AMIAI|nr:FAD-binding oxidoreductase [Aminobacter aminovorans]AMS45113.1 D-amino acid oxidase [Aminobacter aminovorans]MBB3705132.1 glycine/D-amino acid oxidase-like deaminating enzyme [Aminobacter aminovorans]